MESGHCDRTGPSPSSESCLLAFLSVPPQSRVSCLLSSLTCHYTLWLLLPGPQSPSRWLVVRILELHCSATFSGRKRTCTASEDTKTPAAIALRSLQSNRRNSGLGAGPWVSVTLNTRSNHSIRTLSRFLLTGWLMPPLSASHGTEVEMESGPSDIREVGWHGCEWAPSKSRASV